MLADCIRLAQTNNEALEALLQKFAPLIKKCGRQLHIEDGNEEMILAFIELVKDFSPSNLRNIDDGTVVQYIKQSMYHYCFRIYKKRKQIGKLRRKQGGLLGAHPVSSLLIFRRS